MALTNQTIIRQILAILWFVPPMLIENNDFWFDLTFLSKTSRIMIILKDQSAYEIVFSNLECLAYSL